jgi:hypothetical protein
MALTRLGPNNSTNISGITNAQLAGSIDNSKFANIVQSKNSLINGDMQVSQRGTSFTSNGYTLDRYTMDESTDGAVTVTQDTDVPSGYGFAKSLKVDCTTADASIGAAQYCGFTQLIEGQNLQYLKYGTSSAQTLTLSFWVKSVKTGIYCVRFVKEAGGETRYECPIQYTISSASTWEKKTIILTPTAGSTTFIQNSAGAIVNSNASGFRVFFALAVGSNFQGTNNAWTASSDQLGTSSQVNFLDNTSNNFWITGVQLEAGTAASDFEFLPYSVNLQRCMRYYEKSYNDGTNPATVTSLGSVLAGGTVAAASTSYLVGTAFFINSKRGTPTITLYDTQGASGKVSCDTPGTASSNNQTAATGAIGYNLFMAFRTTGDSRTNINFHYTADAEL